jgi:hypothetical protein
MKNELLTNLNDPKQLEKMYRTNKVAFRREFNTLYPGLKGQAIADFWNERLNYESDEINWGTGKELIFVVIASLIAGLVAKIPTIFDINEDYFFPRNIGFIVFPFLTAYFAWKNKLSTGKIVVIVSTMLVGLLFINFFPDVKSDVLVLSCIHIGLLLWSILGFAFVGSKENNGEKRVGFLKYNGELIVMTALIGIAGLIMSGITLGLFSLIGFNIEKFYFQNIGVFGAAAAPIVATFLTQTNPQLVGKVSPVIAKLFSPIVLVMLIAYLIAIVYSGKNPYNDREFLLIFNALLIGVMSIIFFSVAETVNASKSTAQIWVLFLLSLLTIIVNGVAFSAIIFRISSFGITPNRAAVVGSNFLILINLLLVTAKLYKVLRKEEDINGVRRTIAYYLPIYVVWTIIVTFIFPLLFGFK